MMAAEAQEKRMNLMAAREALRSSVRKATSTQLGSDTSSMASSIISRCEVETIRHIPALAAKYMAKNSEALWAWRRAISLSWESAYQRAMTMQAAPMMSILSDQ